MENDRNEILECLQKHAGEDESLITAITSLCKSKGNEAYTILFHILTNLDLPAEEAEKTWLSIVSHWENLCKKLDRTVNIRTALCDYFCSINKSLHNPKVIEIHLFEQTEQRSKYDKLTKLFNRHYFDDILEREFARAVRHSTDLSLLFLDLDNFKNLNDDFGHPVGDEVLKKTAEFIIEEKRTEDIATRYGGEELAIILPETDKINALVLGERIRLKLLNNIFKINGQDVQVTISGGVSSFPQDSSGPEELLKKADQALYHAKASGKNMVTHFSTNKRQYLRMDFQKKIAIRCLKEKNTSAMAGSGKNISIGGILFESEKSYDLGDTLELTIPIKETGPLYVTGTVVRIETYGPTNYDIGIAFPEAHETAIETISDFISSHYASATEESFKNE